MTATRTVLQTNGLVVNAWLESVKPVMPDLSLRKLMTKKTKTFMFNKRSQYKSTITEKKDMNVRFIENFSATNRTLENVGGSVRKTRERKKNTLTDIEITEWETRFKCVLTHSLRITDQIEDHDRTRPEANGASMSEYHMNEIYITEPDRPISKEVRQPIWNLKQGRAPSLDSVCGEYLKKTEANITPFLTLLFNKIYDCSCFPSDWCKSIKIPFVQKRD